MSNHPQQPYGTQPGGYEQQNPGSYAPQSSPQHTPSPEHGVPPQQGASPGAPLQHGVPTQPAVPPQHGVPPQPGAPPQHGVTPHGNAPQHPGPYAPAHPGPTPGPYGGTAAPGRRSKAPLLIGVGALAMVLVLGLAGWFLWPKLAPQPTLSHDKIAEVYVPAISGISNRKDAKPTPAATYFKTTSKDECVIQTGNVLAGGQLIMPLDSVADGGASEHGWFVVFDSPATAKATMTTLDTTLRECRGGGLTPGASQTRTLPAWYTYDGPFDASDKTPSAQLIAVQYGNTLTVSTPQKTKAPGSYVQQVKDRIDALT